ncbi:MAG: DUF3102 domain-containing protein [Deltaproteobacteria bacterium]|nr:DUF3102 domain-containing protein [Deltaproteobacteria bacterium]
MLLWTWPASVPASHLQLGRLGGRGRSGSRTYPPRRSRPPRCPVGDHTLDQLTHDILDLLAQGDRRAVSARAEVGRLLSQVRQRLPHGAWTGWLEQHVPFNGRTAERAIRLHGLSRSDPKLFARLAPLGVSKADVLITLPRATVEKLLAGRHAVPSTGARKPLVAMSFAELMGVIAALDPGDTGDATATLLGTYRRQIRTLIGTFDALIEHRRAIADEDLVELYDKLLDAAARLAHAFSLDDA